MTPYRVSPAADADLDDQAAYLAREAGSEVAYRFIDAAFATFDAVARMPGIGERRESMTPRLGELRVVRVQGFFSHLIFYLLSPNEVLIVRILHGARDIAAILAGEFGLDPGVGDDATEP